MLMLFFHTVLLVLNRLHYKKKRKLVREYFWKQNKHKHLRVALNQDRKQTRNSSSPSPAAAGTIQNNPTTQKLGWLLWEGLCKQTYCLSTHSSVLHTWARDREMREREGEQSGGQRKVNASEEVIKATDHPPTPSSLYNETPVHEHYLDTPPL